MSENLKKWWGIKTPTQPKPVNTKPQSLPVSRARKSLRPTAKKNTELDDVVVTSGDAEKEEVMTYEASPSTSSELQTVTVNNDATALQGCISGVTVTNNNYFAADSVSATMGYSTSNATNNAFIHDENPDIRWNANSAPTAMYDSAGTTINQWTTTTSGEDKILTQKDSEEIDYTVKLKSASKANRYSIYLQIRNDYKAIPIFFFKAAEFFFKDGDTTTGLKVLSNLAELNLSNYELDRLLGYKLKQEKLYNDEADVFKKVLDERPEEPQSYRDYALALEDAGFHQQALDKLYEGLTKHYDGDAENIYHGIEEIFLPEINRIISFHKDLNTKDIEKELIQSMPVDLRVVINWNKSNTDIDLWVTDPNGEKCYFSHKETVIRGRLSTDFTQGFGPEQFLLKNAPKGKYRIQINYFGDRQVTIAGPTTVMAEIYKYYGTSKEEKKVVVLQMEKGAASPIFIGNVEF